jgi:hypothetical protein
VTSARSRRTNTSLIVLLGLLVSCWEDSSTPTLPTETLPQAEALVTAPGTAIGTPVTQTITATGGAVTAGGIKLEVLPGTVSGANLTLQPITDTLNGSGQGIAISSSEAWSKYVKISFPIAPSDESPEGLGIAVQQADGSWLSLEPVKVDKAAGTVTAGLPATLKSASLRAKAGLKLTSVVKFKRFYFKPSNATVKVKKTQVFTPYAQVVQNENKNPNCGASTSSDDLAPICEFRQVTREYPFTNNKDGFIRLWAVNAEAPGNPTIGTISSNNPSGATYTAPDKKPDPDTVTVTFQTLESETGNDLTLSAKVKIKAPSYRVTGSSSGGNTISGQTCDPSEPFTLNSQYNGISISLAFQPANDTAGSFSGSGSIDGGTISINGSYTISDDPAPSENASLRATGTANITVSGGSRTVSLEPINATMTSIPPC